MTPRSHWRSDTLRIGLPGTLLLVVVLGPYLWMALTSLRPNAELLVTPVAYLPHQITFDNYRALGVSTPFMEYFLHSLLVASGTTLVSVTLASLAAYGFSRFRFPGRNTLRLATLVVYLIPAIVLVVPLFVVMVAVGLVNSVPGLILGHLTFALPFSIWMLSGYFDALPLDLDEAAMVDGATRLQAFARIVIPLALPGLVATGLFSFLVSWNEFVYAVMLTTSDAVRTLPVGLQLFMSPERATSWGILSAGGLVTSLPVAVAFLFFQKYLIGGLTAGSVK